jgi:hypothetical protein
MAPASPVPGDPDARRGSGRVLQSSARPARHLVGPSRRSRPRARDPPFLDWPARRPRPYAARIDPDASVPRGISRRRSPCRCGRAAKLESEHGALMTALRGPPERPLRRVSCRDRPQRSPTRRRRFGRRPAAAARSFAFGEPRTEPASDVGERARGSRRQNFTFLPARRTSKPRKIASIGFGPASPRNVSVGGGHPGTWNRASWEQRELPRSSGEAGGPPPPPSAKFLPAKPLLARTSGAAARRVGSRRREAGLCDHSTGRARAGSRRLPDRAQDEPGRR